MKSREGTVVDADDLIAELIAEAARIGQEQGKAAELDVATAAEIYRRVGLGALKYFMLKIDPVKGMQFNPKESVDFNGNTGPFLQYTCARAQSILNKLPELSKTVCGLSEPIVGTSFNRYERVVLLALHEYGRVVAEAAAKLSPAVVANYVYDLACRFNQFYHECPIARESDPKVQQQRLLLTSTTLKVLRSALLLLGIETPEQM